jgi:thioredoxin-like negative regulator of GroEL
MSTQTPLLAFFTNPRSGPARRMDSLLAHVARRERGRLRLRRVDVEQHPELARRLRVDVVPTLLLIKGRRVVGRLEGRVGAPRIEQMIEAHLDAGETAGSRVAGAA